jgi:hypothetical protein
MCNFFSWGVLNKDTQKKLDLKSDIIFMDDDMAKVYMANNPSKDWDDVIGHEALAEYYHISEFDFDHNEGVDKIPAICAKAINSGKLNEIQLHVNGHIYKYTCTGARSKRNEKKLIEEWIAAQEVDMLPIIEKVIKQHNLTITAKAAIQEYEAAVKEKFEFADCNEALSWGCARGGFTLWSRVFFQLTGKDLAEYHEKRWPGMKKKYGNNNRFIPLSCRHLEVCNGR